MTARFRSEPSYCLIPQHFITEFIDNYNTNGASKTFSEVWGSSQSIVNDPEGAEKLLSAIPFPHSESCTDKDLCRLRHPRMIDDDLSETHTQVPRRPYMTNELAVGL